MSGSRHWFAVGAILAALAVAAGAFGAHGIEEFCAEKYTGEKQVAGMTVPLSWKRAQDFNTGARYHMYHALGLIAVGVLSRGRSRRPLQIAAWSFLLGTVLFSGSLYALTLTGRTWWGMVAPLGGVLFIVGWIALAAAAFQESRTR
ncbi:MAG: DUF423 domain-containing protein [Planctomycetaceae bacterium]